MNGRRSQRLFFVELVLVLFSFALCAAVCVALFAKAHRISAHSREVSAAAVRVQEAAEAFKAMPNDLSTLSAGLGATFTEGKVIAYYDDTWHATKVPGPRRLQLDTSREGSLVTAHIAATLNGETLFSLSVLRMDSGAAP